MRSEGHNKWRLCFVAVESSNAKIFACGPVKLHLAGLNATVHTPEIYFTPTCKSFLCPRKNRSCTPTPPNSNLTPAPVTTMMRLEEEIDGTIDPSCHLSMSSNTCGVKNNPRCGMALSEELKMEDDFFGFIGRIWERAAQFWREAWWCRRVATFGNKCTGTGIKVGPRLRESRLLTPSGRSGRVHAT